MEGVNTNAVQKAKTNSYILADFFIRENQTIVFLNNKKSESVELFYFTGKIYEAISDHNMDCLLNDFMARHRITDRWKLSVITEIKKAICTSRKIKTIDFDCYNNLICFNNGILNIDNNELIPHSSKYYFTSLINIDYNPDQKEATNFNIFLEQIFKNKDTSTDYETIDLILKLGGYLLHSKNTAKVMFIFLGDGANGKSLLIELFSLFFDSHNITYTELEILTDSKSKERESILQSRVNFSTETSGKQGEINPQQLKKIISGEAIDVLRKYKGPIKGFKSNTKIIMAANHDPYLNDTSYGMDRRIITISFPCKFVTEQKYKLIDNPTIKNISILKDGELLLNSFKKELPAILNLFIKHLKELKANHFVFLDTNNTIQTKIEYAESTDSIGNYLKDNFKEDKKQENVVFVQDILATYRSWHNANISERPLVMSAQYISKRIKSIFNIESFSSYQYQGSSRIRKKAFYLEYKTYEDEIIPSVPDNQTGSKSSQTELSGNQDQQSLQQSKEDNGQNNDTENSKQENIPTEEPGATLETQILNFRHE